MHDEKWNFISLLRRAREWRKKYISESRLLGLLFLLFIVSLLSNPFAYSIILGASLCAQKKSERERNDEAKKKNLFARRNSRYKMNELKIH